MLILERFSVTEALLTTTQLFLLVPKMKTLLLFTGVATFIVLTVADADCTGKEFDKDVKQYEWCLAKGYSPTIDSCKAAGEGKLSTKQSKKCKKAENSLKKCNYDCRVQTGIKGGWVRIPGGLTRISKGNAGIWGVNAANNIFRLNPDGQSWTMVSGGLAHVSSGASVWGVNKNDNIFRYQGNNVWEQIPGGLTNVDVSNKDHVWGVNRNRYIYRRVGSTWVKIEGGLKQISVGESGVWGIAPDNSIFYREGTYGDKDTSGSAWKKVPGNLTWVSSGSDLVVGVNSAGNIYYRKGITAENPTGTEWVKVPGGLWQIDVNGDEVVGTNSVHNIFRSPVGPV